MFYDSDYKDPLLIGYPNNLSNDLCKPYKSLFVFLQR